MKIKVKSAKIAKAVKKMYGIEIEVESTEDATEAIGLILRKMSERGLEDYKLLKEIGVTASQNYETSAVDYELIFLLDFIVAIDEKEIKQNRRDALERLCTLIRLAAEKPRSRKRTKPSMAARRRRLETKRRRSQTKRMRRRVSSADE